jgi:Ca2+-binding EF-hand superfamily protein
LETNNMTTQESSDNNLYTLFKFYDLNSDGVISREELKAYFKSDKVVDGIIERLDKNKDGVISYSGTISFSYYYYFYRSISLRVSISFQLFHP